MLITLSVSVCVCSCTRVYHIASLSPKTTYKGQIDVGHEILFNGWGEEAGFGGSAVMRLGEKWTLTAAWGFVFTVWQHPEVSAWHGANPRPRDTLARNLTAVRGEVSPNRMQIVQPALHDVRPSYRWNKGETSLVFHLRENPFEWCFYINTLLERAITDKIKVLFHLHWLPHPLGASSLWQLFGKLWVPPLKEF